MTENHTWHVVMNDPIAADGKIYLDDKEMEIPVTGMTIHLEAQELTRIHVSVIPRRLDALLTFAEENPLVVEVHWPQCPHCGKFYDKESMPAKLTIPPVEEKPPFDWGEDHRRANRHLEEESNGCD